MCPDIGYQIENQMSELDIPEEAHAGAPADSKGKDTGASSGSKGKENDVDMADASCDPARTAGDSGPATGPVAVEGRKPEVPETETCDPPNDGEERSAATKDPEPFDLEKTIQQRIVRDLAGQNFNMRIVMGMFPELSRGEILSARFAHCPHSHSFTYDCSSCLCTALIYVHLLPTFCRNHAVHGGRKLD